MRDEAWREPGGPGPWRKIRIIRRPEGEAPEWVRDAWIGLELPLLEPVEVTDLTGGVLTGPTTPLGYWWARLTGRLRRSTGYVVASARAIDLLAETRLDAAEWWRVNTPIFCEPDQGFIFDTPACEPSSEPLAGRPWG